MTDSEWEDRQTKRQDEMKAVSEALAILTQDDAHDTFVRTYNPSLQQKTVVAGSARRNRIVAVLRAAAKITDGERLLQLAQTVQLDSFTHVKAAIDKMVSQLLKEQADEQKHRDFCIAERNENDRQTAQKDQEKTVLSETVEQKEREIEKLSEDIANLKRDTLDAQVNIKRAGVDREAENKDFQATVSDQRETRAILRKALDVLGREYGQTALAQQGPPPPADFKKYEKVAAGGVMSLLQQIIEDTTAMEKATVQAERDSQGAYEKFVKDTNEMVASFQKSIVDKSEDKAKAEDDKNTASQDLASVVDELEELATYSANLHQSCDFIVKNFDVRQTSRSQEVEALRPETRGMRWYRVLDWAYQVVSEACEEGACDKKSEKDLGGTILKSRELMNDIVFEFQMPIPLAYYHLITLLTFCVTIMYSYAAGIVAASNWLFGIVFCVSVVGLLGIREIGMQMAEPFGDDDSDLPVDMYVMNVLEFVTHFIEVSGVARPRANQVFANGTHWVGRANRNDASHHKITQILEGGQEFENELAEKEGPYETYEGCPASKGQLQFDLWDRKPRSERWDWTGLKAKIAMHGLRNSLLVAPMPTASTAQILGNNESFEPYTMNLYVRRVLAGEFVQVNKHLLRDLVDRDLWTEELRDELIRSNGSVQQMALPAELKELYKTVWEIKQRSVLDHAALRGAYIDQSQSLNIHMTDVTNAKLSSMHFYGWSLGLKTGMYYLRTKAAADAIKFTVDAEKTKKTGEIESAPHAEKDAISRLKAAEPKYSCVGCSA